ncbi:PREDICTED: uncharacterized protein LOC106319914 [Brassica oleracea var. oleracea]|uniref:uncharacterized protein LOC106319914 n=1 Tax=Brassica oleracea var. oleracea TaxID=109376 RepID=UPI0006A6AA93|nr:PREDICTED: uncharacterized protein LOC106319914 [Brassica oleracea var. oleracea]
MSSIMQVTSLKDVKPFKSGWKVHVKVLHTWKQYNAVHGDTLEIVLSDDNVMELGDLETIQVVGKPKRKVEFTLRDINDSRVPCCLWGKFAEVLYEGCSKEEEGKPICLIRFVDEDKPLALWESNDEKLELDDMRSIQDKRDKWLLFPKRTIREILESTQSMQLTQTGVGITLVVAYATKRFKLHLMVKDDTGETKLMLLDLIAKGMIIESAMKLLNGSFDEV